MTFDEIHEGQFAELVHTLTADDVARFVDLTGDDNRLHTDPEFAASTTFKKPVVHGMLGASFISTIIGTKLPGDGALWFGQNLEFLLPARVGDTLTIRAEVTKKDVRARTIELATNITNQHRQKVTQGVAKVKIVEPTAKAPDEAAASRDASKVALVVGGSGGIGSAACVALAKAGFDVAVHYHANQSSARRVGERVAAIGRKHLLFSCDIIDEDTCAAMVDKVTRQLGGVSALVNCSTLKVPPVKFSDLLWKDFELHLLNQIKGSFNITRAVVPQMEARGYGKIINIDTQYVDAPEPNLTPYITAKGALRSFSRSIALDLGPKGIRVNLVAPGMTQTELLADVPERIQLLTAARTPLRRLATPDDVANTIVFLASAESDFLCGETIRVNGGQVMR